MDILQAIEQTFSNVSIVSSITSTVFVILLGWYLRRAEIFGDSVGKTLSRVALKVAIPALSFNSFMQPIDTETLHQGIAVLIWGILVYLLLIFITPLMYPKAKGDRKQVLAVLTTFGSTTFFGIPIVGAVFGAKGIMYSSIFNIGYRIFLYSYGYMSLTGLKMKASNIKVMLLNPVVIATFLGFIMWICQSFVPHVNVPVAVSGVQGTDMASVAFYRIDQTAIWLWKPLNYLAGLSSPLAWLAIGITLGSVSFGKAATNKVAWYYSFNKVILVPLLNIIILSLLVKLGVISMSYVAIATIAIMMATPTATVAAAYAISSDREALLTSNASFISTIAAVVMTPVWIAGLQILHGIGLI